MQHICQVFPAAAKFYPDASKEKINNCMEFVNTAYRPAFEKIWEKITGLTKEEKEMTQEFYDDIHATNMAELYALTKRIVTEQGLTEDFLGGCEPNMADFYMLTCFKLFDILYYFNKSEFPAEVNAWCERMLKLDGLEIYDPESRFSTNILGFMYQINM